MGETLYRFLLGEVRILRVRCKTCSTVIEVELAKVELTFSTDCCPVCHRPFQPARADAAELKHLAESLQRLNALSSTVEVELTFPEPDAVSEKVKGKKGK